jgi:hypothetical protein
MNNLIWKKKREGEIRKGREYDWNGRRKRK